MAATSAQQDRSVPRFSRLGGPHSARSHRAPPAGLSRARVPGSTTFRDLDEIEATVVQHGARVIIVDPRMAPGGRCEQLPGSGRARTLAPLAALAERSGAAVLVIRHLNKGSGPALYRGGGSIGIIGGACAALHVAPDPEDDSRRILAVSKSNLAPIPPGLAYRLEGEPGEGAARIAWEGPTEHTAAGSLATARNDEEGSALQDAKLTLPGITAT